MVEAVKAVRKFTGAKAQVCKVDKDRRLVFGYAIVCKVDGEEYTDRQGEHIPEDVMLDSALDFFRSARVTKAMHGLEEHEAGSDEEGVAVFGFPLTTEIAEALGIETKKTGLLIGMRPSIATFKRFESGELTSFSIGGDGEVIEEELESA